MNFRIILGPIIGILFFFLIYDPEILNPTFIDWKLSADPGWHFLGWYFYRFEPWQWPPGEIANYPYPLGTSIVYTDSIPLLAMPLKLFSPWLPEQFQYFGIWILLSYALQGLFAWLLLRRFTSQVILIALGVALFMTSPVIVQRAWGHEALVGHWLILAALYGYFLTDRLATRSYWVVLLVGAAWTHFYLLAMVGIIWTAFLLRQLFIQTPRNWPRVTAVIAVTLGVLWASMWLAGYFVIPTGAAGSGGLGYYSMNLISPIHPTPHKTLFWPGGLPLESGGQYEGFNYLGLGSLGLIGLAIIGLIRGYGNYQWQRDLPLILSGFLFFFLALSYRITLLDQVILEVPLPEEIKQGLGVLRSSGRLFWPVSYLLLFVAILILMRQYRTMVMAMVLTTAIILQLVDLMPFYHSKYSYIKSRQWESPLLSPTWQDLIQDYEHLILYPAYPYGDYYLPFALFAAKHRKTINTTHLARINEMRSRDYRAHLEATIAQQNLDERSLYIISMAHLNQLPGALRAELKLLDDFLILAPSSPTHPALQSLSNVAEQVDTLTLSRLLLKYNRENYILLIVTKDEATKKLSGLIIEYFRELGGRLDTLAFRGSYAAILEDGRLIKEALGNDRAVEIHHCIERWAINLRSAGHSFGNEAVIEIDGHRLAIGEQRGFNIAVIQKEPFLVTCYTFDTFASQHPISQPRDCLN